MTDYKQTLNLPQTEFPMKANLAQREPSILKKWQEMSIYTQLRSQGKGKDKFVLHMGPPYANGHIHLGTATNNILKDMVAKTATMSGYDAPLVPGWDCHGLPIELNVEKKVGKPGVKISATEFRQACRDYAAEFINIQREEFKRLGIIADWDHPYFTMDFHYEANIVRSLAKIIQMGHLQKGYKPVHWCLDCASALAEAEVEYIEKISPALDVRFKVVDKVDFFQRFTTVRQGSGDISIPIWTTTPWTLPANQAVALNPGLEYVLVQWAGEQLLIAEALLSAVVVRYKMEDYQILGQITGDKLLNVQLKHPFYPRNVPVVLGDHVTVEAGTGAVHTAPAHGVDDFLMGKQYHLMLDNPVGDDGCYTASTPLFAGLHVNKANEKIIAELQAHGNLLHSDTIRHSFPHCWRHKTPLIFRATPQWFVSMEKQGLRQMALAAINQVEWIPDWGKNRIATMVANRPDWCISRQRTWGVPLALFIHKDTGELHPETLALMEQVALLIEKQGIEAWYQLDASTLLGKEAADYQKCLDILDVWFDSGVSHHFLKARADLAFPADLVLEGSDQHRGWFQSLLLTSVAMYAPVAATVNEKVQTTTYAPYKAVLTHGYVVDGQGRKMSKSLGNVIAPEEVIQTLGADVLRLWVASIDYRSEINASKEILARTTETYRRIRNTARFLLANLAGFDPVTDLVATKDMLALDRWAVNKTRMIQEEILAAYQSYQFHVVAQKLHHFCVVDMGGFYLDIIKDRQYTMAANSRGRRSAQTAIYHIIHALVRWLAPILSFTAEEIWQFIPGKKVESVMLTTWYDALSTLSDQEEMNSAFWEKIWAVRDAVNKEIENQRNAGKLGSGLEAEVSLYCGPHLKLQLDRLQDELRFVLITSAATVIAEHAGPIDTVTTEVAGLALKVVQTAHAKCERCWHRRADVNADPQYPGICGRCIENITSAGEERKYA
ncbi:MAG TPA: isoleucine--tRNA ligase [Gammaproteobacteria bacterium]|jgi:isoleucyl-tRNA synthetase|nr:isoleucine--tRNA ligase [Gammaproteobacteria bacterium]